MPVARVKGGGAGPSAEPAASQGLGLRGSWDAVGSPCVTTIWGLSRPGSSWPCWTSCRSCARVTEAAAGSAGVGVRPDQLGLADGSMSVSAADRRAEGKHFREVRVQPPREGVTGHTKPAQIGEQLRTMTGSVQRRLTYTELIHPGASNVKGLKGNWKACTELNVHVDRLMQVKRPTFAHGFTFRHTRKCARTRTLV